MKIHDIANIIPAMQDDEYQALKADIAANGQIEPIWTYRGAIIDGRHRHKACQELGIQPKTREWNGAGSLVSFVLGLNLHRRHLTSSQKSVVGLDILPHLEAEAKERQLATLKQNTADVEIIPPREHTGKARDIAAEMVGTNPRYVSDAKKIQQQAPELIDKVRDGSLTIPEAKKVADLPLDERQEVIELVETGEAKNVQEALKKPHVSHNSGNNEWYTPKEYIDAAKEVMGDIYMDPASSEKANLVVGAEVIYTAEDSGLEHDWKNTVWLNPPYASSLISDFCEKLAWHYEHGDIYEAITLVNNATETAWFCTLIDSASAVCFPSSRVRFYGPDGVKGTPLQGQAVIYMGPHPEKFKQGFKDFGWGAIL